MARNSLNSDFIESLRAQESAVNVTEPTKEELVSMSKSDLDALIDKVRNEFNSRIEQLEDRNEKLRLTLEKNEKVGYLKQRGEFAPETVQVRQSRPLGPVDHMDILAKEHESKLKGKRALFANARQEIRSLRRAQGYEPVRDESGEEFRYMDAVLMAMPEQKYQETIVAPVQERRDMTRTSIIENVRQMGDKYGITVEGDGITYDKE